MADFWEKAFVLQKCSLYAELVANSDYGVFFCLESHVFKLVTIVIRIVI